MAITPHHRMSTDYDEEYYHNKGQEDGVNDDYDPPYDGVLSVVTMDDDQLAKRHAYLLGYYHVRGEIDGAANEYNAPSDDYLEAYNAGRDARD
jgi:hypothetical protein